MGQPWNVALERWMHAGLLDSDAVSRIREFEAGRASSEGLRWPAYLALAFGGLMLAAGVLLFVSAHWDTISPSGRFAVVLLGVAALHIAAIGAAARMPGLATALHAVGTVAFGGAIFLTAQIFNLEERWSTGVLLWAIGAAAGWMLLDDLVQMALAAILVPAWLASEWIVINDHTLPGDNVRVLGTGVVLLALAYFTASEETKVGLRARVLRWVGGFAILPATLGLWVSAQMLQRAQTATPPAGLEPQSPGWLVVGWSVALGLPLLIAFAVRKRGVWMNAVAAGWVVTAVNLTRVTGDLALYVWFALGATALTAWGVRESSTDRINVGSAVFAATVIGFYFSQVMDKLGRSASLAGFGALFLIGGWLLEKTRRRLILNAGTQTDLTGEHA